MNDFLMDSSVSSYFVVLAYADTRFFIVFTEVTVFQPDVPVLRRIFVYIDILSVSVILSYVCRGKQAHLTVHHSMSHRVHSS